MTMNEWMKMKEWVNEKNEWIEERINETKSMNQWMKMIVGSNEWIKVNECMKMKEW